MAGQAGSWSVLDRLEELSKQGDPLEKLSEVVDLTFRRLRLEMFRPIPRAASGTADRSMGGRPPFDSELKFKMLFLRARHGLSLERAEHLVRDRLSWMRFCGLSLAGPVPGDVAVMELVEGEEVTFEDTRGNTRTGTTYLKPYGAVRGGVAFGAP